MTQEDFNTAKGLLDDINFITAVQNKNATSGAKVVVTVTDASNRVLVHEDDLKKAIGDSAYNTVCSTALSSLNTQLSSAKTTKQSSFDALGVS